MSAARELTAKLQGRWHGGYGTARCPGHDDHHPSLSMMDGSRGRPLLKCHAGCSFEHISASLTRLGHTIDIGGRNYDPKAEAVRKAEQQERLRKRAWQAQQTWEKAAPIHGTLGEAYLTLRGITAALPDTLRYLEDCWHISGYRYPAMIAYVTGSGSPAIHRTFLQECPIGKAKLTPNKAMLGQTSGGAVRLAYGPDYLVIAEGIETALSLASGMLDGNASVWAGLSASGMKAVRLPDRPGRLVIAADGDPVGREAAQVLGERATVSGWKVDILCAPDGHDYNDQLLGKVGPNDLR